LVIFLPGTPCQKLNGLGDGLTAVFSIHNQVYVIRGDNII
jgi:hypothetical protein